MTCVTSQALETLFNDPTLEAGLGFSGAGTASSLLYTQISQEVSLRKVRRCHVTYRSYLSPRSNSMCLLTGYRAKA